MKDNFSGAVVRSLHRDRGRVTEFFRLYFDVDSIPDADHSDEIPIDTYLFVDQPKLGPAVVYRRIIDISNGDRPWPIGDYLAGNLAPDESFWTGFEQLDIRSMPSMPDALFWEVIATLDGSVSERSVRALVRRLVELGEGGITGFAQTLAAKLTKLDTPELLEAGRLMDGGFPLSADAGLYLRCAVVASGPERFERAVSNNGVPWSPGESVEGESLLGAAATAFEEVTSKDLHFLTTATYETGGNTSAWGDRDVAAGPAVRTAADIKADIEADLAMDAVLNGADPVTDVWYQYEHYSDWYSTRFFIAITESLIAETIAMFAIPQVPFRQIGRAEAEAAAEAVARDHAASIGGTLLMPVETLRAGLNQPLNRTDVFWTERRFKGSNATYLEKFGLDG